LANACSLPHNGPAFCIELYTINSHAEHVHFSCLYDLNHLVCLTNLVFCKTPTAACRYQLDVAMVPPADFLVAWVNRTLTPWRVDFATVPELGIPTQHVTVSCVSFAMETMQMPCYAMLCGAF
jgi:hypothetical protein